MGLLTQLHPSTPGCTTLGFSPVQPHLLATEQLHQSIYWSRFFLFTFSTQMYPDPSGNWLVTRNLLVTSQLGIKKVGRNLKNTLLKKYANKRNAEQMMHERTEKKRPCLQTDVTSSDTKYFIILTQMCVLFSGKLSKISTLHPHHHCTEK